MTQSDELNALGFDEGVFRQKCSEAGVACSRCENALLQMQHQPSTPPEHAWALLKRTKSGDLARRVCSESSDFTSFAARMTGETVCPSEYLPGFWKMLKPQEGSTPAKCFAIRVTKLDPTEPDYGRTDIFLREARHGEYDRMQTWTSIEEAEKYRQHMEESWGDEAHYTVVPLNPDGSVAD